MIRFISALILLGAFMSWDYHTDFAASLAMWDLASHTVQNFLTSL